ncbi:MAG TPA: hypothetical protein PLW50_00545 [Smithellaceae bacterium]|nr:hypothetical protein [Smithellaceae bacterium]
MTNSGSAIAAINTVNVNEYLHNIKEGQIKNYIWDAGASAWVKDPGTVLNLSGAQITVDISGDLVWCVGQSGADVIATISGDAVTVSGNWVDISGSAVSISGNALTVSGDWVDTSGAYFASGQWVEASVSGNVLTVLVSGGIVRTVSGNWVNTSGNYFASGQWVKASVSGNVLTVLVSGGIVRTVSGNWVNTSGNYFASGQWVEASVSGNVVNISGEYVYNIINVDRVSAVGSGAVSLTYTATEPRYFEYAEYHATSGIDTSNNLFVINHVSAESGYSVVMYSLDMKTSAATDLFYQPDSPMVLMSGDGVKLVWDNASSVAYYARITTRR